MGNRAVVAFTQHPSKSTPVIYLHWNGGRASIEGFLAAAKELDIHEIRAFGAMIKPWMDSVYDETYGRAHTDNWDNGVYLVDAKSLEIVGRRFMRDCGEEVNPEKSAEIHRAVVDACRLAHPVAA